MKFLEAWKASKNSPGLKKPMNSRSSPSEFHHDNERPTGVLLNSTAKYSPKPRHPSLSSTKCPYKPHSGYCFFLLATWTISPASSRFLENTWSEVVESQTPGLPFVAQPSGVTKHHVFHAILFQGVVKAFGRLVDSFV